MTLLITTPPTTNGYNTIATGAADPETTATVPHVTARRSTWTTTIFAGMVMLSAGRWVWWMHDGGSSYHQSAGSIEVVAEQDDYYPSAHYWLDDADKDTPNLTTPAAAGLVQSKPIYYRGGPGEKRYPVYYLGFPPLPQTEEVPGRRGGPRTYCTVPPRTATFGGTSITAPSWPVPHPFEVCYKRGDGDAATYCWAGSQCLGTYPDYGCYGCYPKGDWMVQPWVPIETADVVNGCDKPCQKLYGSSDE